MCDGCTTDNADVATSLVVKTPQPELSNQVYFCGMPDLSPKSHPCQWAGDMIRLGLDGKEKSTLGHVMRRLVTQDGA